MFYVQATLQAPEGRAEMKDADNRFPRKAYVCWDTLPSRANIPCFRCIDDPAVRPVSREEAELLVLKCQEVHGAMYNHNLIIVPA